MIIIFSQENDITTDEVCHWLNYYNQFYIRFNYENSDFVLTLENEKLIAHSKKNNMEIDILNVKAIWYRRGEPLINNEVRKYLRATKTVELRRFLENEIMSFQYFVFARLEKILGKKLVDNYNRATVNKLIVLDIARQEGLYIPNTTICDRKFNRLNEMLDQGSISKPISEVFRLKHKWGFFKSLTTVAKKNLLGDFFFYSLFQNEIIKKYEIRSFCLNETFFSMAIISQNDEQTKVDFRNYNDEMPNRSFPFKLPQSIEKKLLKIKKRLKLVTCSFDLVYTEDKKFVFLEVNPVGQFGMVSYPCNYYLECKIAKYLCNL